MFSNKHAIINIPDFNLLSANVEYTPQGAGSVTCNCCSASHMQNRQKWPTSAASKHTTDL